MSDLMLLHTDRRQTPARKIIERGAAHRPESDNHTSRLYHDRQSSIDTRFPVLYNSLMNFDEAIR
jgi:hypothetical protein